MALSNPLKITYGSRAIGGDTVYQIDGAHVLEKSMDTFRLVLQVVVVASSYATLESLSTALEGDFRKRDQSLTIDFDSVANAGTSVQTYTFGSTMLKSVATISKTGNDETDRGYSRAYTVSIEAELPPPDNTDGLRTVEVNVSKEPGNQTLVTMRGEYVAANSKDAYTQYLADFDAEAATYLAFVKAGAAFELVDQDTSFGREKSGTTVYPHSCQFTRQYVELLYNQSLSALDDEDVKNHDLVFTDLSQHPGDSAENIYRLRRVSAAFTGHLDIEQSTSLQTLWTGKIRPFIVQRFQSTFSPQQYGVEASRVSYNETRKILSAQIQIIYVKSGGTDVIESLYSTSYREQQQIDYTPVHDQGVFSKYADQGWAMRQRIRSRTELVLGAFVPSSRIGGRSGLGNGTIFNFSVSGGGGSIGGGTGSVGGSSLGGRGGGIKSGWNIIHNNSNAEPRYIGDPAYGSQIELTMLTDTITEEYNEEPRG